VVAQSRLAQPRPLAGLKGKGDTKNEASDYLNALTGPMIHKSSSRENSNRSNLSNPQLLANVQKRSQSQVQDPKRKTSATRRPKSNLEGAQVQLQNQLPSILDQHNNAGSNRNSRMLKTQHIQQQYSGDYSS
jgi:hypothetical protein